MVATTNRYAAPALRTNEFDPPEDEQSSYAFGDPLTSARKAALEREFGDLLAAAGRFTRSCVVEMLMPQIRKLARA